VTHEALSAARVVPQFRHATREEYARFVTKLSPYRARHNHCLRKQRAFIDRYPRLEDWLAAPLLDRIGREHPKAGGAFVDRASYDARTYLLFLGLTGRLAFDWEWLLSVPLFSFWRFAEHASRADAAASRGLLIEEALRLGYEPHSAGCNLGWILSRLMLHTSNLGVEHLDDGILASLTDALRTLGTHPQLSALFGSLVRYHSRAREWGVAVHLLKVVLYHRGQLDERPRPSQPRWAYRPQLPDAMAAVIERYLLARRLTDRPGTVVHTDAGLRRFAGWLIEVEPGMTTFADVTRDHLLAYASALNEARGERTGRLLSPRTKRWHLNAVSGFFRDAAGWEWEDMPKHRLLATHDLPKMPRPLPRYIPDGQLAALMEEIRALECPYKRTALLLARWSGARRGESQRLDIDCLDCYPDGTGRLRLPAGKTRKERMVPLNEEAAEAVRALQAVRASDPDRAFFDEPSGSLTRYLFVRHGKPLSSHYLFERPLRAISDALGLAGADGCHKITAHRFRHTVGTQLAERGAKLHTIMAMLGHASVDMSLVYAQISDREVLRDYDSVLGSGATVAGPSAEALRAGVLPQSAIDWLKSNFFKTELELGHCLRLPQEGPCECDLYLTCAKFVTTPAYAPRLRHRRRLELELAEDAEARGWPREVERHNCVAKRLEGLLKDLGEPLDEPEAIDVPASAADIYRATGQEDGHAV
jgi:integrase